MKIKEKLQVQKFPLKSTILKYYDKYVHTYIYIFKML